MAEAKDRVSTTSLEQASDSLTSDEAAPQLESQNTSVVTEKDRCTICAMGKIERFAEVYCANCNNYLCFRCRASHAKFYLHHKDVVERSDIKKWGNAKLEHRVEMCTEHPGKEVLIFCKEHEALCCTFCVSVHHRTCKEVVQIKDVAFAFTTTEHYKRMEVLAKRKATRLSEMKYYKEKHREKLQTDCDAISSTIEKHRKKINNALDILERESLAVMRKNQDAIDKTMRTEIESCAILYDTIDNSICELKNKSSLADHEAFVIYHKCRQKLSNAESLLKGFTSQPVSVDFLLDDTIRKAVANVETIGKVTFSVPTPSPMYTVESFKMMRCRVNGIGQLPSGDILVTDAENQKLKLFDRSLSSLILAMHIPGLLGKIVVVSNSEVLVLVNRGPDHVINILGLRGQQMKVKKKIQMVKGPCSGIAVRDGECYSCHDKGVYVYKLSGKTCRMFWEGEANGVAVTEDGDKVLLLCRKLCGLLTLDKHGNTIHCLKDTDLMCTIDIDVAPNGNIFICDLISTHIVQVDSSGKEILSVVLTNRIWDREPSVHLLWQKQFRIVCRSNEWQTHCVKTDALSNEIMDMLDL